MTGERGTMKRPAGTLTLLSLWLASLLLGLSGPPSVLGAAPASPRHVSAAIDAPDIVLRDNGGRSAAADRRAAPDLSGGDDAPFPPGPTWAPVPYLRFVATVAATSASPLPRHVAPGFSARAPPAA